MKRLTLTFTVFALSAGAALARPDTLQLSCAEAQRIVAASGAAVLGTGPTIYERYVATRAFCPGREYVQSAFVPTRDHPQCHVGLRCLNYRPWLGPGS